MKKAELCVKSKVPNLFMNQVTNFTRAAFPKSAVFNLEEDEERAEFVSSDRKDFIKCHANLRI